MAQSPPGPPPGRKSAQHGPPIGEDYGDFEGDPTSINQMPQGPGAAATPRAGGPTPQNFAQGSPQLSHMGQQPTGFNVQVNPSLMMQAQPGPPMAHVSGVIAQPTPYVSRSRIYAFV